MLVSDVDEVFYSLLERISKKGEEVPSQTWQSQSTEARPGMGFTKELRHQTIQVACPSTVSRLQDLVKPNLSWAEDHFQERISGKPLNPPPSEAWWPYRVKNNSEHKGEAEQFSHTYPERFWPRWAGSPHLWSDPENYPMQGIRFEYGDLNDVIDLLRKDPLTRQAYLPVWFPEDTGARSGQRVPCTLGYQFLIRGEPRAMEVVYNMRSCDILRHFRDDLYMAGRLLQHVSEEVGRGKILTNKVVMNMSSLHYFEGDQPMVDSLLQEGLGEDTYGAPI